jgi:uncharacterized membrane protein
LGDDFESLAYSVSGDGKTVVGYSRNDLERTAFMWDEDHGMRSVQSVLENEFGLDLTGWHLASALDVSQDGRTIVGWGYNPDGYQEAWVAVIPEPGSFVLILLGVVGITQRVRNRSTVRIQRTTYHRQDSNSHQSS